MSIIIAGKNEFPYARQIGTIYCGPACAQMMLKYFQVPIVLHDGKSEQQILFDYISSKPPGEVPISDNPAWASWITGPHRMVNILHGADASSAHWINYFDKSLHQNSTSSARDAFLVSLVDRAKNESSTPPPIIPIHDSSHWVILYQYVDKDGKKSFNGQDPIYYPEDTGIGLSSGDSYSWEGKINVAHKNINFKRAENFLMIEQTIINANMTSRMGRQPILIPDVIDPPISQPMKVIPADTIKKIVPEKLNAFGITSPCLAGKHIQGTRPTTPLLVDRLDSPPSDNSDDYYLIGMQNSNNENYLLVRINATTGLYLDSLGTPPTQYLLGNSTSGTFLNQVLSTMPSDLASPFQQQLQNSPKLVWKPCAQSQSAFFPFYEVAIPATPTRRKVKYYVRIDGKYFSEAQLMPPPNS